MTHRERIRKTLIFEEPDRIAIDNNGLVSGMHEVAYKNLLRFLDMKDEITIYDPVQRLAKIKDEILDLLGVDTRYILANGPSFWQYRENDDGTWVNKLARYINAADIIVT